MDLDARQLRVEDTKSGRPHSIHLSAPAMQVLRQIPREGDSRWIFPGSGERHRADIKAPWERIRKDAKLEGVRLHDLRRTIGSWMAQAGVPLQVIGHVLNHTHPNITRVYARLAEDQSNRALDAFAARLVEVGELSVVEVGTLTPAVESDV